MIRDELMQRVVHRDSEPITPFVDRIRDLYEQSGISTILVAGSSGSYFHKADCIIQMDSYRPVDITGFAKQEAAKYPLVTEAAPDYVKPRFVRIPKRAAEKQERMDARAHGYRRGNGGARGAGDRVKIKTMGLDTISLNKENIDMRYVEQLVDIQQLNMLGQLLHYAGKNCFNGRITLREAVEKIYGQLEAKGFAMLAEGENLPSNLAMPRKQELFACMNRYRGLYFV